MEDDQTKRYLAIVSAQPHDLVTRIPPNGHAQSVGVWIYVVFRGPEWDVFSFVQVFYTQSF